MPPALTAVSRMKRFRPERFLPSLAVVIICMALPSSAPQPLKLMMKSTYFWPGWYSYSILGTPLPVLFPEFSRVRGSTMEGRR
ncbi:Uncharacterised protein [Flavonifractor plautii]|uniref:Uncharacterized protein n=1 Tax=Flavonifractor plautii TaxID=292800 RepID=A0A174E4Z2_FLAPL|nr:Uncharacterised protein [Flavonifractor plautii]